MLLVPGCFRFLLNGKIDESFHGILDYLRQYGSGATLWMGCRVSEGVVCKKQSNGFRNKFLGTFTYQLCGFLAEQ